MHRVCVAVILLVLLQINSFKFHVPFSQFHYCHVRSEYRVWILLKDRLKFFSFIFQCNQHEVCYAYKNMFSLVNLLRIPILQHKLNYLNKLNQLEVQAVATAKHIKTVLDLALNLKLVQVIMPRDALRH